MEGMKPTETTVTTRNGKRFKEIDGCLVKGPTLRRPDDDLHQVIDGLFIGSQRAASNMDGLRSHGVTHILNTAGNVRNYFPDQFIYRHEPIKDEPTFDIAPYLEPCADFIHEALSGGGKLLCHCNAGVSRSASLILAYLVKWKKLPLDEGLDTYVRSVRPFAQPNVGFMVKLKEFEELCLQK